MTIYLWFLRSFRVTLKISVTLFRGFYAIPNATSCSPNIDGILSKMKRDQVVQILNAHHDQIRKFGVSSLSLFGSVARDQAGPESDVDLLVEFSRPVGLFTMADLQLFLQDILGCQVDLGTPRSLKAGLKESVLEEAIHVA